MAEYVRLAKSIGAEAGVWTGATFTDRAFAEAHPTMFVRDAHDRPARGPWINYGMDATVPEAARRACSTDLPRVQAGRLHLSEARHDSPSALRHARSNPQYAKSKGIAPADIVRRYFEVIREEVGPDVFILVLLGRAAGSDRAGRRLPTRRRWLRPA